jgi:hypothetical protein
VIQYPAYNTAGAKQMHTALSVLSSWCSRWRMKVNISKSAVVLFGATDHSTQRATLKDLLPTSFAFNPSVLD